jgi:Ser-Thr-rich glycosyl-phosphatidyl-inositol-anchored membrane family
MIIINTLLCVILGFLSIIEATVTSPSASTVWTNGATAQITWNGIQGNEVTIVLTRTNTVFYHTIVSYAPNSGNYTWQVEIPPQDGWPSSTASDLVYEIEFYVNGGWNNGGTLVDRSQQFAIQWSGSGVAPATTVILVSNSPTSATGLFTTVQTQTIVGATTMTTVVTLVYKVDTPNLTQTLVQASSLSLVTQTLTNAQTTTVQTTFIGATTIGATPASPQAQQLPGSGTRNSRSSAFMNVLGIIMGAALIFG